MGADNLVWITGAGGLIGNYLQQLAPRAPDFQIRGLTRACLNLEDFAAVEKLFRTDKPTAIIHCAAISKSPVCQANPALAWKVNVDSTKQLAELAHEIPFVFFSTDLVFDGRKGDYVETDEVNPLSVYAETKVAAEKVVLANPRHSVIRTSLNGGSSPTGDRGFNEETHRAWQNGKTLKLFTDEFRSPIPAAVTARAIWELIARNQPGVYHLAGSERLSRYEIGKLLAAHWPQLHPKFEAASLREYQGAPRPPDTSLNCDKIQQLLSFKLPGLGEWLREHPSERF